MMRPFIAHLSPVVIGMEACGGAHYWARRFREHGHEMRLIAPQFVRPYVKSNKNDPADAQAICEAVTRPTMRFVPIKGVGQQDLQSFHRARERVVKARTALVNEIRGLLGEYGIVLPQCMTKFRHSFMSTLEAERAKLTMLSQELFAQLYEEFCALEKRLAYYNKKLEALGAAHPVCQRLLIIPVIGPLTPQPLSLPSVMGAILKTVGSLRRGWASCRDNIPLVARRARLGISKRGDAYLRKLLIHGARSTLRCGSDSRRIDAVSGSEDSSNDEARTRQPWLLPIRTRGLPGCC